MDKSTNESSQHQISETFTEQFRQAVADHAAERNTLGSLFVTYLVGSTGNEAGATIDDIMVSAVNSLSLTIQVVSTCNYDHTPEHGIENAMFQASQRLEALGAVIRNLLTDKAAQ